MDNLHLTFLPLVLGLVISWLVTPLVIYLYRHFGWVVDPKRMAHPAHVHKEPVPKGGGIPVLLGTLVPILLLLPLDKHLVAILIAGLLVVVVGVLDDIFDLSPLLRLATNFGAALIVIGAGIGISYITNPLGGVINLDRLSSSFMLLGEERKIIWLADLFALVWIPFVMNAVNWSSGLDGQVAGIVPIAAGTIGILSFSYSADVTQWPVAVAAFALAGAFLGYLPYSFFPQKTMPGYGGTSFAGFMLATLAILSTTKVGTALVVLGVPLIDAIYVGVRRIAKGKAPWRGGTEHLHHKLLELGWGKRRIAVFYWLITAALGLIALNLDSRQKFYTIALIAILLGGFLLWISFGQSSKRRGRDSG